MTPRLAIRILFAFYLAQPSFASDAEPARPSRTVEAVLQELTSRGIDVIYSSSLVPPDLIAPEDIATSDPLEAARAALAHHRLALRQIGPNHYVVVAAPASDTAPSEEPMQEVSVYASRYAIDAREIAGPLSLHGPEIASIPGAHDDALRALKALPGLAGNVSARPHIRGSLSQDVLVRYDGITLLDPYHLKNFQSLFSAIDPAAIDGLEVFSGGFPVQYGTRSGGVINIEGPASVAGFQNRVAASLISAGASSIGTAEGLPLEWFGAIRHSTLDLLKPVREGFGTPRFSDSLGRLRWNTEKGAWTAGWLVLDDQLELNGTDDTELAKASYRDEYVWLARDHRFNDELGIRLAAVITAAERERSGSVDAPGIAVGTLIESQVFDRFELTNDWTYDAGKRSSYTFGAGLSASRARYFHDRAVTFGAGIADAFDRPAGDSMRLRVNPRVVYLSVYGANRRKWKAFEAELGVRLDTQDYEGLGEHSQLSPRLNLRYDFTDRTRFYASVGRFTQAQPVEEWRVEEGQLRSDPAQSAIHSILGVTHESPTSLRWSLEVYAKNWTRTSPYFDNLLNPLSLLPELAPDRVRIAPRSSEASGLELNVRAPIHDKLNAWGSLSWSRVADDFGDEDVLRSWDQSVALTVGASWEGPRFSLSALGGWHRGWPRTPYEIVPPVGNLPASIVLGDRNGDRWADYFSLDLRGAWRWPLRRADLTTTLEVTNSTNRANACCTTLEGAVPGQPLQLSTDHWLPVIVNLAFVYRWRRE